MNEELKRLEQYSEKAVCNKIGSIMKKGKQMYIAYKRKPRQRRSTHRRKSTLTWKLRNWHGPILKCFTRFKDHPALGPGAVDDSAVTPLNVATEVVVPDEQEDDDDSYTLESTRCPSRASKKSTCCS